MGRLPKGLAALLLIVVMVAAFVFSAWVNIGR
jgi:hypothetical protein